MGGCGRGKCRRKVPFISETPESGPKLERYWLLCSSLLLNTSKLEGGRGGGDGQGSSEDGVWAHGRAKGCVEGWLGQTAAGTSKGWGESPCGGLGGRELHWFCTTSEEGLVGGAMLVGGGV